MGTREHLQRDLALQASPKRVENKSEERDKKDLLFKPCLDKFKPNWLLFDELWTHPLINKINIPTVDSFTQRKNYLKLVKVGAIDPINKSEDKTKTLDVAKLSIPTSFADMKLLQTKHLQEEEVSILSPCCKREDIVSEFIISVLHFGISNYILDDTSFYQNYFGDSSLTCDPSLYNALPSTAMALSGKGSKAKRTRKFYGMFLSGAQHKMNLESLPEQAPPEESLNISSIFTIHGNHFQIHHSAFELLETLSRHVLDQCLLYQEFETAVMIVASNSLLQSQVIGSNGQTERLDLEVSLRNHKIFSVLEYWQAAFRLEYQKICLHISKTVIVNQDNWNRISGLIRQEVGRRINSLVHRQFTCLQTSLEITNAFLTQTKKHLNLDQQLVLDKLVENLKRANDITENVV